jgi:hypothetical protein
MFKLLAAAAAVSVTLAAPASALTVLLGGPTGNAAGVTVAAGDVDLTITAAHFTGDPATLGNFSQLTSNLQVRRTAPGLGVNGGGSAEQVDTNQANRREALVVTGSKGFALTGVKLSYVDRNDTLMLYGVDGTGKFWPLVFAGTIQAGAGGTASFVNSGANNGTTALTFLDPFGHYDRYVFTTRVGGDIVYAGDKGQGYRLDSISLNVVPEPQTWALFLSGFAMVGASVRRNRRQQA